MVEDVKLDPVKRRIDFEVRCQRVRFACPQCSTSAQPANGRPRRSWQHPNFFQFEAWLHADVPRVACIACGKTTQLSEPCAAPGFTAAAEALALRRELLVRQATALLRCSDKQRRRRIACYVEHARDLGVCSGVDTLGIDETSLRCGHDYLIVVHALNAKRLLFAPAGRDQQAMLAFAADLKAHETCSTGAWT